MITYTRRDQISWPHVFCFSGKSANAYWLAEEWCFREISNPGSRYITVWWNKEILFHSEDDAILFRLRWS